MEKYIINGPSTLHGEVEISGAKNAAVAIIPATVLAQDVCVIENVPNISDVTILFQILKDLGAASACILLFPGRIFRTLWAGARFPSGRM